MGFKNKFLSLVISLLSLFILTGSVFAQNGPSSTYTTTYAPDASTTLTVEVSPIVASIICNNVTVSVKTNIPATEVQIVYKSLIGQIDTFATATMIDQYTWKYDFNFSEWPDGILALQILSLYPNGSPYGYTNSVPYSLTKDSDSPYCAGLVTGTNTTTVPQPTSTSTSPSAVTSPQTTATPSQTSKSTTSTSATDPSSASITTSTVPNPNILVKEDLEKLPLIPKELKEVSKISKVENKQVQDQDGKTTRQVISFSGKSVPNSLIYLYIFSDPIIISVQVDSNGDWEYTLDKPLERGKHEVYLVIQDDATKEIKRSEGSSFFITKAVAKSNFMDVSGGKSLTLEDPFIAIFRQYILYVGVAILLAIFVIISINFKKRKAKRLENADE